MSENFPLRPYQTEAVQAILDAISNNKRRMSVHMATGTGIHRVGAELIRRLASSSEKQKSITALFDRKESIEQFEELCKDICAERDGLRLACFTFANASAEKRAALRESDFILCYYGNISPSDAYKENKVFQKCKIRGRQLPERERKTDFRYLRRRLIGYAEN